MKCPCQNNFTIHHAFLWVAIGVLSLFNGLLWWHLGILQGRQDNQPVVSHSTFQVSGAYPIIRVNEKGWDIQEPVEQTNVFEKKGNKK